MASYGASMTEVETQKKHIYSVLGRY